MYSLVLLFSLLPMQAATRVITFAWDAMPAGETWTEVRLYEQKADLSYILLGKVTCTAGVCPTTLAITFTDVALHNVISRSYDAAQTLESLDSNMVTVPKGPIPPGHLIRK